MDGFYSGSPLGLNMLLADDTADHDFFSTLPQEIQWQVEEHMSEFSSMEEVRQYAHKLMNE